MSQQYQALRAVEKASSSATQKRVWSEKSYMARENGGRKGLEFELARKRPEPEVDPRRVLKRLIFPVDFVSQTKTLTA